MPPKKKTTSSTSRATKADTTTWGSNTTIKLGNTVISHSSYYSKSSKSSGSLTQSSSASSSPARPKAIAAPKVSIKKTPPPRSPATKAIARAHQFGAPYAVVARGSDGEGTQVSLRNYGGGASGVHLSRDDGSYAYVNPDGSTYRNNGRGYSTWIAPSGYRVDKYQGFEPDVFF